VAVVAGDDETAAELAEVDVAALEVGGTVANVDWAPQSAREEPSGQQPASVQ